MIFDIMGFFEAYSLGRKLHDFTYNLCLDDIIEATNKAGDSEESLRKWLDENT